LAEQWEPDESRGSRPVLPAAGGEIPPADSPGYPKTEKKSQKSLRSLWPQACEFRGLLIDTRQVFSHLPNLLCIDDLYHTFRPPLTCSAEKGLPVLV